MSVLNESAFETGQCLKRVEDKYHYRFWSQIARWMAHQRHLAGDQGIRLSFSPENPKVGDTVYLHATILDVSGFPVEQGEVTAAIQSATGDSSQLRLQPVGSGWGVYKGEFIPEKSGDYTIEVEAPEHNRNIKTTLQVSKPIIEKIGQPIRSDVLKEISKITLARNSSMNELEALIKEISILPEPDPREQRFRLWASSIWGAALLSLLAIYWIGRKLTGQI